MILFFSALCISATLFSMQSTDGQQEVQDHLWTKKEIFDLLSLEYEQESLPDFFRYGQDCKAYAIYDCQLCDFWTVARKSASLKTHMRRAHNVTWEIYCGETTKKYWYLPDKWDICTRKLYLAWVTKSNKERKEYACSRRGHFFHKEEFKKLQKELNENREFLAALRDYEAVKNTDSDKLTIRI